MQKLYSLIIILLLLIIAGCSETSENKEQTSTDKVLKETTGYTEAELETKAAAATPAKKYSIKSGVITFRRTGVTGNQKVIVYFDDYGIKERSETYTESGEIDEIKFSDGENMYKINKYSLPEKAAYIMGPGNYGTEMKFDGDPFKNDAKRKEKYAFQKLPNMNIIGKDCEAYSTEISSGKTIFAGWNSFLLYSKTVISIGTSETVAIDFQENVSVNSDLFKVPSDFFVSKL